VPARSTPVTQETTVVSTSTTMMDNQSLSQKRPSSVVTTAAVKVPRVSSTAAPHRAVSVRSSYKSSTKWSPAEESESRRRHDPNSRRLSRRVSPYLERSGQSVTVSREEYKRLLSNQRSSHDSRFKKLLCVQRTESGHSCSIALLFRDIICICNANFIQVSLLY